jgi:hypothetical protein
MYSIVKTASEVNAYLRKVGQSLVGLSDVSFKKSELLYDP